MTRKIFRSIALVAVLVFLASIGLIMGVLYTYFTNIQVEQMHNQAILAAQGIDKSGEKYTEDLNPEGYRLTWIAGDGQVLYDSAAEASKMENHLDREEVQQALEEGEGYSSRYSTTLLERRHYVARKASDGSIIRISDGQHSILGLLYGMLQQILIVALIAFILSLLLAYRLSKRIIQPLNEIDLDRPEKGTAYKELQPLLERMQIQQDQIRQQTRQLRQKQQEFDASTANMEEGLLILNEAEEIISMNRAASRILGVPMYSMGRPLTEADADPMIQEAFRQTLTGEKTELQMEIDGTQYELHASPVSSADKITAVVIFILDISQRQREEQMRREFTANVSHELKTPLQTISGSAELIAEGMVKPEDVSSFGRKIHTEASRLITLIDDIIGLSRLDEGAEDMRKEDVDMFAVAEREVAELAPLAEKTDVRVTFSGEKAPVTGDPAMLASIVHNLCENAIKYSGSQGSVDVSVRPEAGEVRLTVADNGIGISEEEQERVFERFYRVDKGRSKEVGGTGLGLSIVKHAVNLHHGRIDLVSRPGEGTTVTVILPGADR